MFVFWQKLQLNNFVSSVRISISLEIPSSDAYRFSNIGLRRVLNLPFAVFSSFFMTTSFYILDSRSFEKTELGKQEVQKSREIDEVQETKKGILTQDIWN